MNSQVENQSDVDYLEGDDLDVNMAMAILMSLPLACGLLAIAAFLIFGGK